MIKKIILFCLISIMLSFNCYAFDDVSDYNVDEAVRVLSDFSIINGYDDNTFKPYNNVTRAEFAKIMIATTNMYTPVSNVTSFSDTVGHWAEDYIDIAKYIGIINGVSDSYFAPNENVTYEQAIKMIVVALGYNDEALSKGGYPNGYISVAEQLGITNCVYFEQTEYATRGNVALMIRNALDVEYNGTGRTLYEIQEDVKEFNSSDVTVSTEDAVG